jgi:ubiquinone/menaquinone biosynthesis C-methylase UbiE
MTASKDVQVDYTGISRIYDNYRSYSDAFIKRVIELGRIGPGKKALDLGCGTGNVSYQIRGNINADLIGIDVSPDMLRIARNKSLEVVCSNIDNRYLPFREGCFDTVVGAYVIHQIKNLNLLLSECYRVIRKGILLLLTSSHRQIENQHPIIKNFFPSYISIDKARFPDIEQMDSILESQGFQEIGHEEVTVANIPIDQEYLQKVKSKYVSTYHLMPHSEFEDGVRQLEAYIKNSRQPEFRSWHGTIISSLKKK